MMMKKNACHICVAGVVLIINQTSSLQMARWNTTGTSTTVVSPS